MKKGLVVARYNENLDWINFINKDINVYIYNKGEEVNNPNLASLPNIGREAHTYLTHIVNNYNNLDDILIFSQGNPDHIKSLDDFNLDNSFLGYKTFVEYYAKMIEGEPISQKHSPNNYWMGFKFKSEITPSVIYNLFYNKQIPLCWVAVCAIFAVDKYTILKHKKEKYQSLLELFNRNDKEWMAYVMEYTWTLLFKENGYNDIDVKNNII